MNRKIEPVKYILTGPTPVKDPHTEIEKQSSTGRYKYLLAHADDGLIWGYIEESKLVLSSDPDGFPEISPQLRSETLWEARLFGEQAECYLWQNESGWQLRQVMDGEGEESDSFLEEFILWGTNFDRQEKKAGFFQAEEADLGIRHTPPVELKDRHSLKLQVRHYLNYDPAGVVFVKLSRRTFTLLGEWRLRTTRLNFQSVDSIVVK